MEAVPCIGSCEVLVLDCQGIPPLYSWCYIFSLLVSDLLKMKSDHDISLLQAPLGLPLHLELQPRCLKITFWANSAYFPHSFSCCNRPSCSPSHGACSLPWGLSTRFLPSIFTTICLKLLWFALALILHDFLPDSDLFEKCYILFIYRWLDSPGTMLPWQSRSWELFSAVSRA